MELKENPKYVITDNTVLKENTRLREAIQNECDRLDSFIEGCDGEGFELAQEALQPPEKKEEDTEKGDLDDS